MYIPIDARLLLGSAGFSSNSVILLSSSVTTIPNLLASSIVGFLLGELLPHWAVAVFTTDEELIRLAAEGMRIVFLCFPIIGFQMVTTNFFQSIGMAPKAIFLSLSRQLLFLLPGLLFLPDILAGMDICT